MCYDFQSYVDALVYFDQRRVARILLDPQMDELQAATGANPLALRSLRKRILSHRQLNQDVVGVHEAEGEDAESVASMTAASAGDSFLQDVAGLHEAGGEEAESVASETAAQKEPAVTGQCLWAQLCSNSPLDPQDALNAFSNQSGTSACRSTHQVHDRDDSEMCKVVVMAASGGCIELQLPMSACVRNVRERLGRQWGTSTCNVKLLLLDGLSADIPDSFTMRRLCTRGDSSGVPVVEFTGLLIDFEWCALSKVGLDDLLALSTRGTCSDLDRLALHTGRADSKGLGKVAVC